MIPSVWAPCLPEQAAQPPHTHTHTHTLTQLHPQKDVRKHTHKYQSGCCREGITKLTKDIEREMGGVFVPFCNMQYCFLVDPSHLFLSIHLLTNHPASTDMLYFLLLCPSSSLHTNSKQALSMWCVHASRVTQLSTLKRESTHAKSN